MSYQQPSLISPPLSQSELEQHLWEALSHDVLSQGYQVELHLLMQMHETQ
jgi:hypothetical protein